MARRGPIYQDLIYTEDLPGTACRIRARQPHAVPTPVPLQGSHAPVHHPGFLHVRAVCAQNGREPRSHAPSPPRQRYQSSLVVQGHVPDAI